MTLRDIVVRAQEIVGQVDLTEGSPEREKLISAARFILAELAGYADLIETETVYTSDKTIEYDDLGRSVKRILSVSIGSQKVPFMMKEREFTVPKEGTYEVEYTYYPERKEWDEEVELAPFFGLDEVATGVAAEYFFKNGFTEEAILYKNRYDVAVKNALRVKKSGRLPYRRFV